MHKYRLIAKKGEGTFSEVLKAQSVKSGKHVAIKCMKNNFDSLEQINNLREIQALRRLSPHPNVIRLIEVLYDQPTGRLALVFELMEMNAYELIRGRRHYLPESRVKHYVYQLLRSMDHMHRNGIFHRDIKPENILLMDDELKLADFGSCRGIYSKQPYTEYISTRWYRAPECLLTDGFYNYKMDMWGVGCVFFEIMALYPLFPGTNELDQVQKIHNILGTPSAEMLAKFKRHSNSHIDFNFPHKEATPFAKLVAHASPDAIDLISKLLAYSPDDRISARQALRHPLFRENRDAEKRAYALNQALSHSVSLGYGDELSGTGAGPSGAAGTLDDHGPAGSLDGASDDEGSTPSPTAASRRKAGRAAAAGGVGGASGLPTLRGGGPADSGGLSNSTSSFGGHGGNSGNGGNGYGHGVGAAPSLPQIGSQQCGHGIGNGPIAGMSGRSAVGGGGGLAQGARVLGAAASGAAASGAAAGGGGAAASAVARQARTTKQGNNIKLKKNVPGGSSLRHQGLGVGVGVGGVGIGLGFGVGQAGGGLGASGGGLGGWNGVRTQPPGGLHPGMQSHPLGAHQRHVGGVGQGLGPQIVGGSGLVLGGKMARGAKKR